MTITMYCFKTNNWFILDIRVLFTYCDVSVSSNFSSQEFQLKIIIPLENLVSYHQTVQIMSVVDISYALLILSMFLCLLAEYRAPTPVVATPKPRNDAGDDDDDEPPLNEDDDDDDELDDLEQGEDEPNTQHLVLAQFDKVGALLR